MTPYVGLMFRPLVTALLSAILFAVMMLAGAEQTERRGYPPIRLADQPRPTVIVVKGDHMWKISERELTEVLRREPGTDEVHPYWVATIAINRDSLRSGDPDLIFPGEELTLPEVNS
jgi:nucleoid-associated protein YgaU